MWFITRIVGLSINCSKERHMYTWMHNSRETFTLRSILGPPIPKENANGNIFSIFMSAFLAYVPPYANRVGAERWNMASSKISEDPYWRVLWWVLCSGEVIRPAFVISFHSLVGWIVSVVFLSGYLLPEEVGGNLLVWMCSNNLDDPIPLQTMSEYQCTTACRFLTFCGLFAFGQVSFYHTVHNIYACQCPLD